MQQPTNETVQPIHSLTIKELTELLIKTNGIHEGKFELSVEFQIGVGGVGPSPEMVVPGAMVGVNRVGLTQSIVEGPNTVDASLVNPKSK
ncbi:hypothetical protein [Candidatus Methylopumilus turicensis]|uniref:Uncharacterized protein n=1 Tax=Candidatus Methylopumilus turicensis TaxID=1581680 RepID=A0A0B7J1C9_9PROT|nr:hypothetical protein [Candidatus Methylopumilus turicensis]CEN56454.1 conserved protein of unknown function [Candidatus Methylopumilus turicensis]